MSIRILKKCGVLLLCAALCFAVCSTASAEAFPGTVSAKSAILISADTGTVLYEKNALEQLPMASTTKIMTALLALEKAEREGDPIVSVTQEMVAVEGSSMGLRAGDRLSLTNLTAGMLLASGNDAANAAALFVAGSAEKFADLMNARASEIGMEQTHFVTPSGLDDEAHYSTAHDMALLARAALKNESFRTLASSSTYRVEFQEPEKMVDYTNHNKLLWMYEGCIGVKTGFTKKSGRCLVSAAERDGMTLIAVTLNAPDDWEDHRVMLDYGFSTAQQVTFDESGFRASLPVVGGDMDSVTVAGMNGGSVTIPREDSGKFEKRVFLSAFLYAPVQEGDVAGRIGYYLDGAEFYSVPLTVKNSVSAKAEPEGIWERVLNWIT